jgi:predicted DNA binding CopG/RHH family protein
VVEITIMEKYTDHNGKEVKASIGTNVRISDKVYDKVRKHCMKNGLKIGKFCEQVLDEKLKAK